MAIFESFLRFPLFKQCSTDELFTLLSKVCLDFEKVQAGACILETDSRSKGLLFLLEGSIMIEGGRVVEAPAQLAIERIFGHLPISCPAIYAQTDCHLLFIDQDGLLQLFQLSSNVLREYLHLLSDSAIKQSL